MGRFGIGARVRDDDGDLGTVIAKSKGLREVEFDRGITGWVTKCQLEVAEIAKFKVGDRVRALADVPAGEVGTIHTMNGKTSALVEFDTWRNGHTACGVFTDDRGWSVALSDLGLVDEPAVWVPQVGDRVRITDASSFRSGIKVGDIAELTMVSDGWFEMDLHHERDGVISQVCSGLKFELVSAAPAASPPFRIETGKTYRARDGRKIGPMAMWDEDNVGHVYPWADDADTDSWSNDGSSFIGRENSNDLVAEWVEEVGVTARDVKPGDRVRLLDGNRGYGKTGAEATVIRDGGDDDWYVKFDRDYRSDDHWYVPKKNVARVGTPMPAIGSTVTFTGIVAYHNNDNSIDVTVDGHDVYDVPGTTIA